MSFEDFQSLVRFLIPQAKCRLSTNLVYYLAEYSDLGITYDIEQGTWECISLYHVGHCEGHSLEFALGNLVEGLFQGDFDYEDYGDGGYPEIHDSNYAMAFWKQVHQSILDIGGY